MGGILALIKVIFSAFLNGNADTAPVKILLDKRIAFDYPEDGVVYAESALLTQHFGIILFNTISHLIEDVEI